MAGSDQLILAGRLRAAAQFIADDARRRSAGWSRRIPGSVRLGGGASRVVIRAGGQQAPSAYTWEGKDSGAPRWHPVFATGPRSGWTWVPQIPVRPFMREAVDANIDEAVRIFAEIVDDWAHELGYR